MAAERVDDDYFCNSDFIMVSFSCDVCVEVFKSKGGLKLLISRFCSHYHHL